MGYKAEVFRHIASFGNVSSDVIKKRSFPYLSSTVLHVGFMARCLPADPEPRP